MVQRTAKYPGRNNKKHNWIKIKLNKVIIYVGNFDFSEKIAAGNRVLGISYALRDIGYKVILVGCDTKTSKDEKTINTKQFVDEFEAYMLPYAKSAKEWLKYKKQY